MKMNEMYPDERPREKLLSKGAGALSNGELIAVLLRAGTKEESALDLAQRLLAMAGGSLVKLAGMSAGRIASVNGIKEQKAASVLAALELGRRFMSEVPDTPKTPICSSEAVFRIMKPKLKALEHEECWVIFLNRSNLVTDTCRITCGGDHSTIIDSHRIIRMALERKASAMILVHNHPSSNPRPSDSDVRETEALHEASGAMGIDLLDHVIVCDGSWYSFSEEEEHRE